MYFNILKIPFYDNDRMCHSYLYSIHPYEAFRLDTICTKYKSLYDIIISQRINKVSGFHNYVKHCYYILCIPSEYTTSNRKVPVKDDEILYVYDYLSNHGYTIQTKDYRHSFDGYNISKHFGEIIATIYKP